MVQFCHIDLYAVYVYSISNKPVCSLYSMVHAM